MFKHLTARMIHDPRRTFLRKHQTRSWAGRRWDCLEDRVLLTTPPLSLVSANYAGTDGAAIGALFPSISENGQYVAFESGSFEGDITPAPSDLVKGLTVQNDAPNVYLRDQSTNTTICLSLDYQTGTTGNNDSRYPVISANGNTVVFLSNATDLTANDTAANNPNNDQNVFAWVRKPGTDTGTVQLVTVNYEGNAPANDPDSQEYGTAENISVSANGDYIAYDSQATNLVPNAANIDGYTSNVYVRDLLTGKTILVSSSTEGADTGGDDPSDDPVISSDGSTVAYDSLADDLDPSYTSGEPFDDYQVYASTLNYTNDTLSATHLVSVDPTGTTAGNGTSIEPSLSDNGQMVAFQSAAENLVNIPNGGSYNDVYVRDLTTGTTQLVSVNDTNSATGDSSSFDPQISGDGDHILFYSLADDLNALTTNDGTSYSNENVFERNLTTNTTQLVSVNYEGTNSGDDTSTLANQTLTNTAQQATGQISDDGQYVVFQSVADNLVSNFVSENGGAPYGTDVYLRDTVNGKTTLLSHAVGLASTGGTGESVDPDIIPDGLDVAFQSAFPGAPDNLVSNDAAGQTQLYNVDLVSPVATTITATAGTPQSATVNTAFATALQATVTDQNGDPFSGATVTFTAPSSGASGTFSGGKTSVTETTNASGVATAPTFTANATVGSYTVTASVSGVATSASFSLTNTKTTVVATSITAVSGTGTYGGSGTLTATLTAGGEPFADESLTFKLDVNGTLKTVGSATTGTNGVATLTGVSLSGFNAGTVTAVVGASFAGNAVDEASTGSGNLTVSKAPLTVVATSVSRTPEKGNPTLTYTITGFVNGDTSAVVSGAPVLSTTATSASPQGNYPITIALGSLAAKNYTFSNLVNSVLTVGISPINDYTGAGNSDPAVFRRTNTTTAQWFVDGSSVINGRSFGSGSLDVPLAADFTGDGKTDLAVYRPSTGQWFVEESTTNYTGQLLATFGGPNDIPVPANYNGTGKAVVAVYRPTTGQWFFQGQSQPLTFTTYQSGDIPVPGNYDNTGKDEPAIYRPSAGEWIIDGPKGAHTINFGGSTDIPVPGAYYALTTVNAEVEPAVWRPSTGQFFIRTPTGGTRTLQFAVGDIPAPGDYDGVGETEAAVYRPSLGEWLVYAPNATTYHVVAKFGGSGDTPTAAPFEYRALKSEGGLISKFSVGTTVSVDLGATARTFSTPARASFAKNSPIPSKPQTSAVHLQPALKVLASAATKRRNLLW